MSNYLSWLFLFCLTSCDFSSIAVVKNASSESKKIKVIPPLGSKYVDTGFLKNNIKKVFFDSFDKSYTFILDTGKEVIVQRRFNRQLDLKQKIIVNDYDTIDLQNDKRIEKRNFGNHSCYITLK